MHVSSRHIDDFFIAGFRKYDGALVLDKMKCGDTLELLPEFDNPHDGDAVALAWQGVVLGYIPSDSNALPAQLLRFGHSSVLECRILQINPEADPWRQVRVGLYVTDKRADEPDAQSN